MLGGTSRAWARLIDDLQSTHGQLIEEWNFSGKAYGWSFRLKQKKRILVHMTPCHGHFLVSFALGEKAYLAARKPLIGQINALSRVTHLKAWQGDLTPFDLPTPQ